MRTPCFSSGVGFKWDVNKRRSKMKSGIYLRSLEKICAKARSKIKKNALEI